MRLLELTTLQVEELVTESSILILSGLFRLLVQAVPRPRSGYGTVCLIDVFVIGLLPISPIASGKLRQLLSHSEDFPIELGEFLEPHDNLSWMHHVATQDYTKVVQTLRSYR